MARVKRYPTPLNISIEIPLKFFITKIFSPEFRWQWSCKNSFRSNKSPTTFGQWLFAYLAAKQSHCFLPLPFFTGCASICSFPVTSDKSTSGPRAIKEKNMLFSFSIFLASCAWSVLNLRHSLLSVTLRTNLPSQCRYFMQYLVDWGSALYNRMDRSTNSSHKVM